MIVPAVAAALAPLLALTRTSVPDAREVVVDAAGDGPDAEAALIEHWSDMAEVERRRVWGVVGPLAGVLARFPNQASVGFALLASTGDTDGAAPNAQSRSLLMAAVADSWSLALDAAPPVDAEAWRARLASVLTFWRVGFLEHLDAADSDFRDALGLEPRPLKDQPPTSVGTERAPRNREGDEAAAGWLDAELLDPRRRAVLTTPRTADGQPAASRSDSTPRKNLASKVLRGRHGRLFLAKDSHDSHRQIVGTRPLSREELDAWARGTEARLSDLAALGCRFLQLIGPAPQVVHPEDLPPGDSVASDRPVRQVLERLSVLRPAPDVLYPVDALTRIKRFRDPFSKTDSHWNDLGTFLAYEAILERLGQSVPARRLSRSEVSFHETCYVGDLGGKLDPERASVFLRARVLTARARITEDNRVRNHGRRAVFECDAAPESTCLVFGDSWAYSLMLFLAESFRRVVFFHRVNIVDRAPILAERPAVVLSVMTERFCTALPLDHEAPDFGLVVARKLETHDVVPEPSPHERHPFLFSLALERGLPRSGGLHLP